MRIVAGVFRGRPLAAPAGEHTRPTADRVREALFNILAGRVAESQVLDLFAGSGALGFEALSRGAAHCTFIDRDRRALAVVERNARTLGVQDRCRFLCLDWARGLERLRGCRFDLVFVDPPYAAQLYEPVFRGIGSFLAQDGLVVAECDAANQPAFAPLVPCDQRRYGRTVLTLLKEDEA